ncbi:condensation domain-containing protein [Streptomyces sp. NPDC005283]|uniref:condensation domain-containing protein n=1 Tax=Streptomyces sp. NPDC005283 TaxID=3156871 RepID=UPI0034536092
MTIFHEVRFTGSRSGSAPLTWGQVCIWDEAKTFAPNHAHFNLCALVDVPESMTVPAALTALRTFLEGRESLRTRFSGAADGELHQYVPLEGRIQVTERQASSKDTRAAANALMTELHEVPFSLDGFPVSAGLITCEGRPRHIVLVVFHLAADGWDMANLAAELERLVATPAAGREPIPPRRHPLDQAAREQSVKGQAASQQSVRYWKSQLAAAPSDMFSGRTATPESPRFQEVYLESQALAAAIRALAGEFRVSPATVFLALASILLCRLSGESRSFFLLGCHNRVSQSDRQATGTFAQDAPFSVDVSDADLGEVVHRTFRATMAAYAAARWDPAHVEAAISEVTKQRGRQVDLSCNVNVTLGMGVLDTGPAEPISQGNVTAEHVEALRSRTRITDRLGTAQDRVGRRFFLRAHDSGNAVVMSLRTDTSVLTSGDIIGFLKSVEDLAVRAWLGDAS